MSILSIQSWVAYGHVGNAAAMFPLQLLGFEVWPVNTVNFSNHPAHESYRGGIHHPGDIRETIDEIEKRGVFASCDAVLSGYLGAPETGPVVLDCVERVKAANRQASYILDPVMGNSDTGFFVADGLPEFFRDHAVPAADAVIGNAFEIAFLSGQDVTEPVHAVRAAQAIRSAGPETVCVTGIRHGGSISTVLANSTGTWRTTTPFLDVAAHGSGDLFTAILLAGMLEGREAAGALSHATAATYGVLAETLRRGIDFLALVAAAHELVEPVEEVRAVQL